MSALAIRNKPAKVCPFLQFFRLRPNRSLNADVPHAIHLPSYF
jgi:hypothetical protein